MALRRRGFELAVLLACGVSCLLPTVSRAQIESGAIELGFSGAFHSIGQSDVIQVAVDGGKSLTPMHQVGGRLVASKFDNEEAVFLTGFYAGHLNPEDQAVFFWHGGGGFGDGLPLDAVLPGGTTPRTNFSNLHITLGGGVKAFLTEPAALRLEYTYDRVFTDQDDFDIHSLLIGISLFFGGG